MSIEVVNLSFSYNERHVLDDMSFCAEYGQFLSVLGPNGVGKSTLFRCMLGLLKPSRGDVKIDNISISQMSTLELSRRIAYIPQSHDPVFSFSVFNMVLMGTTAQLGSFSSPGKRQEAEVQAALERLGIIHLRNRSYTEISGGERQLVLIARAVVQKAKILIMDEPSASLDFANRIRVMQTARSLTKEGYCVIQSTHDPEQAYMYSDMILALHDGHVLFHGKPQDAITDDVISRLYGVDVEVRSLSDDSIRVCVPKNKIIREGNI